MMHDTINLALPLIAILAGILFNRADAKQTHERLDRLDTRLDRLDTRVGNIEGDLRAFYTVTGKLEGLVDELARKH